MEKKKEIIEALQEAYWAEIETIINYLANSVNLDGIRAEEIKDILSTEVPDELGHAQQIASRIKELDGIVEGSKSFKALQETIQPQADTTDLKSVVKGVIDAETNAIEQYRKIIQLTDGIDFVTQDMCIAIQADEEKHLRVFRGFLKGLEKDANC